MSEQQIAHLRYRIYHMQSYYDNTIEEEKKKRNARLPVWLPACVAACLCGCLPVWLPACVAAWLADALV